MCCDSTVRSGWAIRRVCLPSQLNLLKRGCPLQYTGKKTGQGLALLKAQDPT